MIKLSFVPAVLLLAFAYSYAQDTEIKQVKERTLPTHESIVNDYEAPEWLSDAKFGIYTHWGVPTYANQYNDKNAYGWYGRLMYKKSSPAYKYHKINFGDPLDVPYHDLIDRFTAPKFNADEWAELFYNSGAKFAGPVAVHHDNFLMWDSKLSPWNSVNKGPKRDISGELQKAITKRNMKFMASFHHGFTYRFYESVPKNFVAENQELYGPVRPDYFYTAKRKDRKVYRSIPRDFQELFLSKVLEFTSKYKPDLIYFDFGLGWQDEDIRLKMYDAYYKMGRSNGQQPTVSQKQRENIPEHSYSTLDLERGQLSFIANQTWLTDNSPGTWFHSRGAKFETTNSMIDRMVDVVSKNGVFLLNIGPDYQGSIPKPLVKMLNEFGDWFKINGEGIYATKPWFTYGEGYKRSYIGHQQATSSESKKEKGYTSKDIRYTQSKDGKTIFAFVLDWPNNNELTFRSIKVDSAGPKSTIKMLGYGDVPFKINNNKTISIDISKIEFNRDKVKFAYGFKLSGFGATWQEYGHFILPNASVVLSKDFENKLNKTIINFRINNGKRGAHLAFSSKKELSNVVKGRIKNANGKILKEINTKPIQIENSDLFTIAIVDNIPSKGSYILEIDNQESLKYVTSLITTVKRDRTTYSKGEIVD